MNGDFTSNNGTKSIRPLRHFCQKVLPLVYDDSLSYYEVLCKVTLKLNEVISYVSDGFSKYIEENFNRLMVEAVYDAETETITLTRGVGEGNG